MRRLKMIALAASASVLVSVVLAACSPPGEQPSDQPGGDPTRGAVARNNGGADGDGGAGTGSGSGGAGSGSGANGNANGDSNGDDVSGLTKSGGRYNLIANHLVEGTIELRHDGKGKAAVTAETFTTELGDGNYELRAYAVASCAAVTGATDDLAVLGELRIDGGKARVVPRTGNVDPVQVLTIAAVKPDSAEVAACGPWIKWAGEQQPADTDQTVDTGQTAEQPADTETNGG